MKVQEYIEGIFKYLVSQSGSKELAVVAALAEQMLLGSNVPWTNIKPEKLKKGSLWKLDNEILVAVITASFMYTRLGAELANELIEGEEIEDHDAKWKAVTAYYKTAIGLCLFGAQFRACCQPQERAPLISAQVFIALDEVCNIGIQMLLLCKSLWLNRLSFTNNDSFQSSNNGVLCRVAIWVFDEIRNCQNIARDLIASAKDNKDSKDLHLCYDNWVVYLGILEKYAASYAALFLSIEYYQKDKIGHALGLVNYALLSIQSKNIGSAPSNRKHLVSLLKSKLAEKRNDRYISNLQSITSLRIDKSAFMDLSGVVLNDLNYIFDQLILFRVKLQKENDNIRFDPVVDWLDVHTDSKWPLGCKIPVLAISDYVPKALENNVSEAEVDSEFSTRQYF